MNVVEFKNVTKRRKDFTIDNLNLTIPEGYITGFIGPNGSGKTTVIQMMMDILQINEGDIFIYGASHKDHTKKQKIGFVYDELFMYDMFTINKMKAVIAPLYDNWNEALFEKYLALFDLPVNKAIKKFSKGMKMKTSLLFALSHAPDFLLMDEPTAGLDPIFRRELLDILQDLMVNEKQTIFFSTHITTDLDRIADHIIFIYDGKVIFQKSMEEIKEELFLIKGHRDLLDEDTRELFIGLDERDVNFTALFEGNPAIFAPFGDKVVTENANLEDIMFYMTRKRKEG